MALRWYLSLARSGQAVFYEPSDYATAWLIAESMSREFNPQPVVGLTKDGPVVEWVSLPPKGTSLTAWLRAMTSLMATEGDRRRVRLELVRPDPVEVADVSELAEWRRRLDLHDV